MYDITKDTEVGLNYLNFSSGSSWYGITAQHREVLNADHNKTIENKIDRMLLLV